MKTAIKIIEAIRQIFISLVGQWRGKENWEGIERAGSLSIGVGFAFMTLVAMALLLFPQFVDRYLLFKNLISSAETRMTQSL